MKKFLLLSFFILATKFVFAQCSVSAVWTFAFPGPQAIFNGGATGTTGYVHYLWDFGDGSPLDTNQGMVHTFPAYGTYNVCVMISDSVGCADTTCYPITLTLGASYMVISIFNADSTTAFHCTYPDTVRFDYGFDCLNYDPWDTFRVELNFGDGIDTIFYVPWPNTVLGNITHIYQNSGNYYPRMILADPDSLSDTAYAQPINVYSTCGSLAGTIYNDMNGNCIYDAGEEQLGVPIQLMNGTTLMAWTSSDVNGVYSFNVPTGLTYDVQLAQNSGFINHFTASCPPSGTITVSTIPSSGNDLGVVCPAGFDLRGHLDSWRMRPGFTGSICAFIYNQNCNSPASGQIELIFPQELTPQSDTGSTYIVTGQTITMAIDSTSLEWSFCVPVLISASAHNGDTVCVAMNLTPVVGDNEPANNSETFCFTLVGSFDPNDKSVSPIGDGPTGLISPDAVLTYTIRFQNTGSAEAINIFILDSLSANLDETSVEIIGTSHPVSMSLLTGNILRFQYDNIMLVDSNTNEMASHGYITYRIRQKANLPQLSVIYNKAGIYFDFNPPVITNTTINTVDQTLSVKNVEKHVSLLSAYPNPADQKCSLTFRDARNRTIHVYNAYGSEVFQSKFKSDSYMISTGKFSTGMYNVVINSDSGSVDHIKLVVFR